MPSRPAALSILVGAAACVLALAGFAAVSPAIEHVSTWDYWFESDVPGVYQLILDRWTYEHWRSSHHPLFSIIAYAPVFVLRRLAGLQAPVAVAVLVAGIAGAWAAAFFRFLLAAGLGLREAAAWTLLAGASAASVFWFPVPEMYGLGALTIVLALLAVPAAAAGRRVPPWTGVALSALVLAVGTGNWMVALLVLAAVLPPKRAAAAAAISFALVFGGWHVQKLLFPGTLPFVGVGGMESNYLFSPLAHGPLAKAAAFTFHAIVLPAPVEAYGSYLSVQGVTPGSGGPLVAAGVVLWSILLALGAVGLATRRPDRTTVVLGLAVLAQLALHLAFGIETFLYSLHYAPLLVALVALAVPPRARTGAAAIAAVLAVTAGAGNVRAFREAAGRLAQRYEDQRAFTLRVGELTEAGSPLIFGARAAAAEGWRTRPAPRPGPPRRVGSLRAFPGVTVERRGWEVFHEDWSPDLVRRLRDEGARYFVSDYAFGFAGARAFLDVMGERYVAVEVTPRWVIYRLDARGP